MNRRATVVTYGCQMNVNDSAKIKAVLMNMGYSLEEKVENANLVIINTCTVRGGAAERVYGKLGQLKPLKERNRDMIIGVAGCLAQEKKAEIMELNPHVDIVFGNQNIHRLGEFIKRIEAKEENHVLLTDDIDETPPRIDVSFSGVVAYVSIAYGCSNKCSYCIVPYVRGKLRSVPMEDVVKEVESYLQKGHREIVLVGQNVNSYAKDIKGASFATLLRRVAAIEGKFRIRFISPHPAEFTDDVIAAIAEEPKISKSIHFPLQSGSTRILRAMYRNHTKERYLYWVDRLRERIKDISITTDIIVGFPGETEDDFQDTLDVVEKAKFDNSYMYMYSKRNFTPAALMSSQIPHEVKMDRLKRLINVQNRVSKAESEKYIGKLEEVLVEGPSPKNANVFTGRTDSNKFVLFDKGENRAGDFIDVKIDEAKTWTLYGKKVLNE